MGCFRVDVSVPQLADRSRSAVVPQMLVDTGSEATWVPREILEQLEIPGARSLTGFNVRVDPEQRTFVAGGPILAAAA